LVRGAHLGRKKINLLILYNCWEERNSKTLILKILKG
jgi:hypothetical protein